LLIRMIFAVHQGGPVLRENGALPSLVLAKTTENGAMSCVLRS
jgi:hypothetical protein